MSRLSVSIQNPLELEKVRDLEAMENVFLENRNGQDSVELAESLRGAVLNIVIESDVPQERHLRLIKEGLIKTVVLPLRYMQNRRLIEDFKTLWTEPIFYMGNPGEYRDLKSWNDLMVDSFDLTPSVIKGLAKMNPGSNIHARYLPPTNFHKPSSDRTHLVLPFSQINESEIHQTIAYLQEGKIDLPYLWLRPSAFIWNKSQIILDYLCESWFQITYRLRLNDFLDRFFYTKETLFEKDPKHGSLVLSAIERATAHANQKLEDRKNVNELWFLKCDNANIANAYETLKEIKMRVREEHEDDTVDFINFGGINTPVKVHSIHTPDLSDHCADVLRIVDVEWCRKQVTERMRRIISAHSQMSYEQPRGEL